MIRTHRPALRSPLVAMTLAVGLALAPATAGLALAPGSERTVTRDAARGEGDAVTWSIEPASADGPDGRVSIRATPDAGAAVLDHVTVTNFSATSAAFRVYASDGVVTDAGDFDLLPSGEKPVDGGSWVELEEVPGTTASADGGLSLELAAGARATIPVRISVPSDATPGDHPAGVVAELAPTSDSPVQVASRVGVRLHLRVTGDLAPALDISDVEASWVPSWNPFAPGTVVVSFTTTNTGNVRLGTANAIELSAVFGLGEESASVSHREILPDGSTTDVVELSAWPLVVGSGTIATTPSVVGDDIIETPLRKAVGEFTAWTIPWTQLAILALAALVVVGFVLLRRHSWARTQARIDEAVAAAREEVSR